MPMPTYSWMIGFSDITDSHIKKLGDNFLSKKPDPNNNYYNQTAAKFINFINSMNLDVAVLNTQVNDPTNTLPNRTHYLVKEWLIKCVCMLVFQDNYGLNNVDGGVMNDVYYTKAKMYEKDLIGIQGSLRYETIVSGAIQQNFTRTGSGGFTIKSL